MPKVGFVVLRSTDYLENQQLRAKVKRLENKHQ